MLAELFKALGEPVRLRLFALLSNQGEICVCHLTDALELPQSTVSRHLSVLRHSGLVTARRDGKWMYYQPADDVPGELSALLVGSQAASIQVEQDIKRLKTSRGC